MKYNNESLLSPTSINRKLKSINDEFKEKYQKKENLIYDFTMNKYIKSEVSYEKVKNQEKTDSKVQDLIRQYNTRINKSFNNKRNENDKLKPINILYAQKEIFKFPKQDGSVFNMGTYSVYNERQGNKDSKTVYCKSDSPLAYKMNDGHLDRDLEFERISVSSNSSYGRGRHTEFTRIPTPSVQSVNNIHGRNKNMEYTRIPTPSVKSEESTYGRDQSVNTRISSNTLSSKLLVNKDNYFKDNILRTPFTETLMHTFPDNSTNTRGNTKSDDLVLYGPSEELTHPLTFKILNTVYDFKDNIENTIYFIEISSNISWIIRKDIKAIRGLLKDKRIDDKYDPYNKNIRDNIIITILNNNKIPRDELQCFILTNITRNIFYKGDYMLYNNVPYMFRLVGKALVSYNKDNRVHKLFLINECEVIENPENENGLYIINNGKAVELECSCMAERNAWINEIRLFVGK